MFFRSKNEALRVGSKLDFHSSPVNGNLDVQIADKAFFMLVELERWLFCCITSHVYKQTRLYPGHANRFLSKLVLVTVTNSWRLCPTWNHG